MRMQTVFVAITTAVSATMLAQPASAQMYGGSEEFWREGWGWGHMFPGALMMVAFWALIILVIVLMVRWLAGGTGRNNARSEPRNNALEILRERFARGEIDEEEYEARRHLLTD